jgi:O-antigen ligase
VQTLTDLFAVHYDGLVSRAQGMTFEPSWLAMQIIVLIVPALIARGVARREFGAAPAAGKGQLLTLAAGFGVVLTGLLCAGSRFGLACIAAMLLLSGWMVLRSGRLAGVLAIVVVLAAGGGGLAAMSSLSAGAGSNYVLGPLIYLSGSPDTDDRDLAEELSDVLAMAGRVATAQAATGMWLDHPLFGVSLGNSYRYFGTYAPDWAFTTQLFQQGAKEGVGWLDPNSPEKGNAKNLPLRLLSETGVVGLLLFALFFVRQIFLTPARDSFYANFRLATAAALIFSFFNQDSFADPVIWIPLALCIAMGRLQSETELNARATPE